LDAPSFSAWLFLVNGIVIVVVVVEARDTDKTTAKRKRWCVVVWYFSIASNNRKRFLTMVALRTLIDSDCTMGEKLLVATRYNNGLVVFQFANGRCL
jgi:hypothetical protein